jgi:CBS domain-containing protein
LNILKNAYLYQVLIAKICNDMKNYKSIREYMVIKPITFHPEQSIYDVINIMVRKKISGAPVVNENNELVGVISEKDCLRVMVDSAYHNLPAGKVSDYMSPNAISVGDDQTVVDVADKFLKTNFKRFPVVNKQGKLVGQISRSDLLRATKDMFSTTWQEVQEVSANMDKTVIKPNFKDLRH